MMYKTCTDCGSHLDHGERCDCQKDKPVKGKTPLISRNSGQNAKLTGSAIGKGGAINAN